MTDLGGMRHSVYVHRAVSFSESKAPPTCWAAAPALEMVMQALRG